MIKKSFIVIGIKVLYSAFGENYRFPVLPTDRVEPETAEVKPAKKTRVKKA